jgi:hypothetical protein
VLAPYFLYLIDISSHLIDLFCLLFSIEEIVESSPVIAEAVSYLTKKVDSKTRDVKVLQPTIATQSVSIKCFSNKDLILESSLTDCNCMISSNPYAILSEIFGNVFIPA